MKKNNLLIILLLSVFLVFAGCGNSSSSGSGGSNGFTSTFNGGSEAMTIEFGAGTPPTKIRDNGLQPFQIRFLVENIGEYDIEEGKAHVSLSGVNPEDINLIEDSQSLPELRGVKKQGDRTIDGSKAQITFTNLKYLPELPSGTHTQPLFANLCYPYKTNSLTSLCISGDTLINYDDENTICDLEAKLDSASSGGPLSIENVEQFPAGSSSIQFQFDIVHKPTSNSGRVYKDGVIDSSCKIKGSSPSSIDSQIYEDYVNFKVETNLNGLECNGGSSEGEIQLSDNRATVYCTQDTTGEEEYTKPISIELSYGYLERISKDLVIEHVQR